jgi:hypothetical protein
MSCAICKQPEVDQIEFEAGNNAEFPVSFPVCENHWNECEKDEWAFRDKYGEKIDEMAYERLIDHADAMRE